MARSIREGLRGSEEPGEVSISSERRNTPDPRRRFRSRPLKAVSAKGVSGGESR